MSGILSDLAGWIAKHFARDVPLIVIEARDNLFDAIGEFNEQLRADQSDDEDGTL
jgi:hypothetical protein